MKKNRSQARDIMLSTLSILGLIVVWFLVSNSKPDFFPTPMATIERFIKLIGKTGYENFDSGTYICQSEESYACADCSYHSRGWNRTGYGLE